MIDDTWPLWIAIPAVLLVGVVLAGVTKLILGPRSSLSFSTTVVVGLVGATLGGATANAVVDREGAREGLDMVPAVALAIPLTLLLVWLTDRFTRKPPASAAELVRRGESASVEFKSTARHNLRTGQKDERIERAVAKTVAGFLNGDGGTLLIGVADDGTVLGLNDDMQHMKAPDVDRYELWLRDYLARTLGASSAALLSVSFPDVAGRQICLIRVAASPRPVFLRPVKSDQVFFYARLGNSTRDLPVDEAISYAADHFPSASAGRLSRAVSRLSS